MMEDNTHNYQGADQDLLEAIEEIYSCGWCRTKMKSIWPLHWYSLGQDCCPEHMVEGPNFFCSKCIKEIPRSELLDRPDWFELTGEDDEIIGSQD